MKGSLGGGTGISLQQGPRCPLVPPPRHFQKASPSCIMVFSPFPSGESRQQVERAEGLGVGWQAPPVCHFLPGQVGRGWSGGLCLALEDSSSLNQIQAVHITWLRDKAHRRCSGRTEARGYRPRSCTEKETVKPNLVDDRLCRNCCI